MFEGLVEKIILSYFGDYIENLDKNKLSVGILSGSVTLEDIVIKAKTINDLKLPFRLKFGRIGKLELKIPWKNNFTVPTVINIESIQIVLSLISQDEWEFLDFISADYKLTQLKKFFEAKTAELSDALVKEEKSSGFLDKAIIKVVDNLHINFKNLHIRIEDLAKKPFYSMGFTLEEMLIVNTNENWQEMFIDRNKNKDINVFKLLKIQNFGFYLKTDEHHILSVIEGMHEVRKEMDKILPIGSQSITDMDYLIKPISLVAKMKQNNKNLEESKGKTNSSDFNINSKTEVTGSKDLPRLENDKTLSNTSVSPKTTPTPQDLALPELNDNYLSKITSSTENVIPKIQLFLNLENFDIDFQKNQFDTIIRILNHISKYQKFQYFNYQSRKFQFYRPEMTVKENPLKWWRYAITTVTKRLKYLQGNSQEFSINPILINNYKIKFQEIYRIYLNNPTLINNDDWKLFKRIIKLTEINLINEWAIDIIQDYFKIHRKEEKQKAKQGVFSKMFGKKMNDENLLSKEEEEKIEEIIEMAKKEIKKEIIHTGKEIKFQIEFKLNQGSFLFSNYSQEKKATESFIFNYKDLNFTMRSGESYSDIEAYLMDFQIDMLTKYSKENSKVVNITFKEKNELSTDRNYVWKLNLRQNGPESKINSKLELHINTLNLIYHQNFLERVISFFIVETRIDEDLKNRAWDKWSEIKEKTSEKIKIALEKKNILEIKIEPRKVIIPLNKYDFKRSRMLVMQLGKAIMSNTTGVQNYEDRYLLDFQNMSILHFNSLIEMEENKNRSELVTDVRLSLVMGILNGDKKETVLNEEFPSIKIDLHIDSININLTENLYYTLHFIIDVMKPTKQQDYWAVVEQSKQEIKKNCKAFCKLNKKNSYSNYYEDYLAVLSGGYIYFYKNADDDEFVSCYYIKDSVITENSVTKVENVFPMALSNKYGNIDLEFNSETKFKQWLKILKERINEMKENFSVNEENNANKEKYICENQNFNLEDKIDTIKLSGQVTSNNPPIGFNDSNFNKISFGLELKINKVTANLYDENKIKKETNTMEKLFTLNFSDFTFCLIMREKDVEISLGLYSIRIFDELYKYHENKESFYEILTSIDDDNQDCKLFYVKILIADSKSPRYKYNSIDIDMKIGFLYAVWQPYSIRRLMMYIAHNDILRNNIKEEILGVPIGIQRDKKIDSFKFEGKEDLNDLKTNSVSNFSSSKRILCTSTLPTENWIKVDISLQKVSIIWVNPITNFYFMELSLVESNLAFEMTYDHMVIKGILGDTRLTDLTNYPYTIKSQNEYLVLKQEEKDKNFKFTEILGFNNSSSLSFEYKSFSPFCPLLKNNYTSSSKVYFNSVRLTYIQEYFFRAFNYLFGEFLGSLSAPAEIKEYRNLINKFPIKLNNNLEYMDLYVAFNNPQVLIKPRPAFDEGFLADLGTVLITNSYQNVKNKVRNDPIIEKLLSIYHFELKNLFLISIKDNFKLIEDTNAKVDMKFIYLTEEDKNLSDDVIDKSFDINLFLGEVVLNLRQKDFTRLMNCSDLNFLYQDGQNDNYNYDEYKKKFINKSDNSKDLNVIIRNSSNFDENSTFINLEDKDFLNKIINGNYMTTTIQIPKISLKLFENTTKNCFIEMVLFDKNLQYYKKLQGSSEIYIQIGKSQIFNYVNSFSREIMMSYYLNMKGIEDKNIFQSSNLNRDDNSIPNESFLRKNTSANQFDIKVVLEKDREKNIIVKIFNIKITLRLDTLQLLRTFFLEGFPYYEENAKDLPNLYDPDEDNYPAMRFYVEIKNPLIALLSETMTNHEQDIICLSTDFVFLYKKEKIIRARKELYDNHVLLTNKLKSIQNENDKKLLEKDIGVDSKDIYLMGLWLYDVCPFMSSLSEILNTDTQNFTNTSYKRNIMNNFNIHYENKTILQYSHPHNYIQSFRSNLDITQITMKISYRDLVLFLKTVEYNVNLMDSEYEEKIKDMTNMKRGAGPKNLINSENKMHPMLKGDTPTKISSAYDSNYFNSNINYFSNNARDSLNNSYTTNSQLNEMTISRTSRSLIPDSKLDDIIINKGMGIMNIETGSIQIILIDDHANTYYPFLSIFLQEIKFTNEHLNFIQNILSGSLMAKIVTYNYYAGMWEPLMEKTSIIIEIINDITDESIAYRVINFNVVEYRPKHGMIWNISDLTITFLYPTLNSWIKKYFKLKSNYKEEVKNMIKDETTSENNMKITNHTVINLSGRKLILHKVDVNKEKNLTFNRLGCVEQNDTYDIEYFEEKEVDSLDMLRRSTSSKTKSFKNNLKNDISLNLIRDNYICFEFVGIDQSQITNNIIKIENIQLKSHKINYTDIIKKYKSNVDLKPFEYIITEIKYHELRKFVYFYSPLVFKNKLQRIISLTLNRKDLNPAKYILKPKKMIGIPFEFLDGTIEFSLNTNDENNSLLTESFKYDLRIFLSQDKPFSKSEFKLSNNVINLITNKEANKNNKHVTINICSSYILRNCLPFDINITTINFSKNQKVLTSHCIKKSDKIFLENLSLNDDLICEIKFLNFSNKTKQPVTLFSFNEFISATQYSSKKPQENSFSFYSTNFVVYDDKNNPMKLFATLVEWTESKTIVIYSNGVIINNSLMDLKFYSAIKNKIQELPGQSENENLIFKDTSSPNSNVFLISDERNILIEVCDRKKGRRINALSEKLSINAIGLSTNFECRKKEKEVEYCYEFILETHLSLIAKDLEIYTNIISIHPRFVIYNNLNIPILVCLKHFDMLNNFSPEILNPGQKIPYHNFGTSSDSLICFRPVENEGNLYQSGSKWTWSLPISLLQCSLMTIQINGINPIEKKYLNIEKKIQGFSTFIILDESNYFNSQFVIENYSRNISMRIYQEGFENSMELINIKSKCIYSWTDYSGSKTLSIEFMIGSIVERAIIPLADKDFLKKYAILDDKIITTDGEEKFYPICEIIKLKTNSHNGHIIKLEIFTDGMQKTIRISDYSSFSAHDEYKTLTPSPEKIFKNSKSKTVTQINLKINQLGLSIISDNRGKKQKYRRNEIVYLTLNDICFFNRVELKDDETKIIEFQAKIKSMQIDNEYAYITPYPIILRPVNVNGNILNEESKTLDVPFLNFTVTSFKNSNNPVETTKIVLLNYLVQSFVFSIDSEVMEALINFISNITTELNTSLTQMNPLFESYEENLRKGKNIKENYYEPEWLSKDMKTLMETSGKYFIQTMETSSIEIVLSFNAQTKSKVFEKYVTSNQILSSLLSTVSNLEKANLMLNGSKLNNLYGSLFDFLQLVLSQYKENILSQLFRIFGAIDVLGNPSNLMSNLGTGVQDFFQKPIQGIIKGPLEGVKGAIDGSVSLVKHTVDGTFSATSKITGGLSKGILYLTNDEKYINELEKKKITERPKNFVEGLGYGITSMASGFYSGVSDVFVKPIEGAKKESVSGFGLGFLKGISGLVAKPVSGVLELVSKTTEGIKNTINEEEMIFKPVRKPRAFYGRFKYIKSYNYFHSDVIDILKNKIPELSQKSLDFYSAEIYKNAKDENILIVFTTNEMFLIDLERREIKSFLYYEDIKDTEADLKQNFIKITFKKEMNGKSSAKIFFSKQHQTTGEIANKIKDAIAFNSESLDFN